jgi:L-aspartate oxidase
MPPQAPASIPDTVHTDVLVIGAGMAGAVTALEAADGGADVIVVQRTTDAKAANTFWAQGGIIYEGVDDSPELLAADITAAGGGLCHPPAVRLVAETGPRLVRELLIERLGVEFDRAESGELDVTEEAAHARRRIIHTQDRVGEAISERLAAALDAHPRVTVIRGAVAVDLLTLSHQSRNPLDVYEPLTCTGAYVLLIAEERVCTFLARETVLATGGLGQLFLHTTNPRGARGDGIAMAYRSGARLINLEYIQFHPTALYHETAPRFLISESVRGEGARLVLRDGTEFMQRHDERGSLAPRDIVARAIHEELLAGNEPCVFLDISHKPDDWIRTRFPRIYQQCLKYGIDMTREPIPVVPAAHYSCGGVATDLNGRTSIQGLRAVGEVACTGLHGANRLASTSLLEALVFGHTTGRDIPKALETSRAQPWPPIEPWVREREPIDPALILQDWLTIKYTMWNYVGLVRSEKRLRRAKQILRELQDEIEIFYARARMHDDLIGIRNGAQAALAILYAAMQNRTSRGCHYRVD